MSIVRIDAPRGATGKNVLSVRPHASCGRKIVKRERLQNRVIVIYDPEPILYYTLGETSTERHCVDTLGYRTRAILRHQNQTTVTVS